MKKLGFIGGGNMAEALISGLLSHGVFKPRDLIASDVAPQRRRHLARKYKIVTTQDNRKVANESNALLLAVKPQQIDAVLAELRDASRGNRKFYISIAAGVPTARLARGLGARARIVRVMPNAPAMVGAGMAALFRGLGASKSDEAFTLKIFRAVGDAVLVRDERLLDTVTALSGSGPAYVYLFVKALADAAAAEGIPHQLAIRMALKTIEGAERVMRASKQTPEELIRIVASPGGTTEAALSIFAGSGFSDIVAAAVHAASARSRELARNS
ncbi:MAG: pyrroline-5-carboxylate reductase [Candidatus Binataceae bacterium]